MMPDTTIANPTNVASVPQRSPFRYPGGKTWLVPLVRLWLASLPQRPAELVEPFAGGGIIGLTVGFEQLAEHVTMIERDDQVAAVWRVILSDDATWLADMIVNFELTAESAQAVIQAQPGSLQAKAFVTIVKNRVNRGGIMAPGAGMIKVGENNKGIRSRWYPATLQRRILAIAELRERFTFIEGDGSAILKQYTARRDAVFFIDPPYTASHKRAGSRLYSHATLDHEQLFGIANGMAGDVLMTYDNAPEVQALAEAYGFDTEPIAMKNTHHAAMTELLIGRDLDWARQR
jgi:DNA adenine methylase